MYLNTLLILGAGYLSHIHTVLFQISTYKFTAHNLILLVGGVFLLYKTIKEIRSKFDKHAEETIEVPNILSKVVINMILIDIINDLKLFRLACMTKGQGAEGSN